MNGAGGYNISFRIMSPIACRISLTLCTQNDILECESEVAQRELMVSIPADKLLWIPLEADDFICTVFKNAKASKRAVENDTFLQIVN
jgi:hypothetical protein